MGAVCSAGTMRPKSGFREKSTGFSGKLKSMGSFSKQNEDRYSYPDVDVFEKTPQGYDSGGFRFSISRELKPSTPARTGQNKISRAEWWLPLFTNGTKEIT